MCPFPVYCWVWGKIIENTSEVPFKSLNLESIEKSVTMRVGVCLVVVKADESMWFRSVCRIHPSPELNPPAQFQAGVGTPRPPPGASCC